MSISVVFVIKQGISQGYCFWESLQSCLPFADELIISEGFSTDGTYEALLQFQNKYENRLSIKIYREEWTEESYHGEAIRLVSEVALSMATKEWHYYLQADEVIHEDNIHFIKSVSKLKYNSISFRFFHFNRAWVPSKEGYKEAIRMVRGGKDIKLKGDAYTFEGNDIYPMCPSDKSPKPIYHFNWSFSAQNDLKDIEHAKLYQNYPEYRQKGLNALKTLHNEKEPYPLDPSFTDFPKVSRRFIGKAKYTLPEN